MGLFGYRRGRVRKLLQERESMAREAEARLRAAEGRILELRHELTVVEDELSDRDAQIQDLGAQVEAFARDPERPTPNMLAEELNSILSSAQAMATRMIERAKAVSERHLQQASEFERALHEDLARMDEWRQEALPLIRAVQSRVEEIRASLEGVAESVAETVRPLEELPDIDRPPAQEAPAREARAGSAGPEVKRFGRNGERDGNGHGQPRRKAQSRAARREGGGSSPDVIEIPDRARAR
jgi:hypothetical protein